ncbi:MAG: M14 metallopeptidase family protein, partial [Acidobacteriota bacterium]
MRKSVLLVVLGLFVGITCGQERFDFYPGGTYDPAIPTLKAVLGYQVGERVTDHHRIGQYLQALAAKSERIRIGTYAVSHEGRDLWYALVSSAENMKRLDEIRTAIGRLTDPRKTTEAEAVRIIASTPAIVWLAYGVHGNEHSSAEASLMTAYQLTAGTDADTRRILQETVTILIPEQNPDGRARFLHFHDVMKGRVANPDPNAAEHNEGWPAGRGNHYLFDMNRDWFFLTQPEIRGQVRLYRDWNPVVFADLHEMGANSTYYFAPPALPINKNLPEQAVRWWKIYGRDIATHFDKLGFDYFTAENYEEFYPGYGSSWPLYKGATGMTYEQASAEGLAFRRRDKTILTLRDAAWHHFTASMSTCLTTAERRQERLKDFYEFFQTAVREGREGPIREFLVAPTDPAKIRKLTDNLLLQGIEARVARAPFTVRSARDFYSDKAVSRQLPAGTVIVPLDQPSKRLIQAIFEREAALDEAFLKEEKRRRDKRDDTQIYDITAWSLAYLYDLEAYWTSEPTRVESEPLENAAAPSEAVAGGRATYAYLMPLETNAEFRALAALLRDDTYVSVARKEIVSGGRRFKRGTIVLRVHTNKGDLHERVEKLARQQGARFFATGTGWSDEGISLGSSNVVYVEKPRVAVVLDTPVSTLSYGWMAHLFDYQYEYPYTAIRASQLNRVALKDYNVLIFPDSGGGLQQLLGKEGLERIRGWVRDGGT